MRLALWCRVVIILSALLFIPAVVTVHAATAVRLEKKFAKYEQFIKIDKSSNKLYFYEKGKLVKSFPVATGKKPSYTPEGLFTIHEKIKNRPYYKEKIKGGDPKNPLGDRWLGLKVTRNGKTSYAYGIHGNNNEKSIGKYVSAGCIRMHNKDVRWLYDQIKTPTLVYIISSK
ncbi:L,D-transpeptidase [Cohnella luojiensis]|uniref:L,D-transpeptidase n=1 Tax=Cohnella luojiensis TaxID=652876 RepID=A0A4Y8LR69_9BACL|nr:L,D-transpeptidase [Cohnella luojiensis]TFE23374.1 L,D-transpeptidase [Cohnella luojiensis]